MSSSATLQLRRQFSLAYVLAEIGLIAIALAAGRLGLSASSSWTEAQSVFICIACIAASGAAGGLCLRMAVGLIAGAVFAVASLPLLSLLIEAH